MMADDAFIHLPDKPQTGALEAAASGLEHGATAGWSDQVGGLEAASGLPGANKGYGGLGMIPAAAAAGIGATRLAYEHLTGQRGPASDAYDKAVADITSRTQTLQQEHPYAYGAGELGGAGASMLAAPELKGATWGARALQGAKLGAGYGAAEGASSGQKMGGLPGAVEGAGIGAAEGAAGGAGGSALGTLAGKAGSLAYDYLGRPITSMARGLIDPAQEAGRRVAGALISDQPTVASGKALGMAPNDWINARAAGDPVMLADLGVKQPAR